MKIGTFHHFALEQYYHTQAFIVIDGTEIGKAILIAQICLKYIKYRGHERNFNIIRFI